MVMYCLQYAKVRWNSKLSEAFDLRNGCKQGAVLSGILYNFYVNGLFERLRQSKSGCWMGLYYVGMVGYADDDWLLAPSIEALQDMLITCKQYNKEHGLIFSSDKNPEKSKTKCIAFLKKERVLKQVKLCGNALPWVTFGKHVGQTITNKCDGLKKDILVKRAKFIDKNHTLRQKFYFAHPDTLLHLNQVFNSDFSGSNVWDLFCNEQEMLENSYSTAVRLMLGLPRDTHRYFIEPLSRRLHIKSELIKRFLTFVCKIRRSKKTTLTYVLDMVEHDVSSVTGHNLYKIKERCEKENERFLLPQESVVSFRDVPEGEQWRVSLAKELVECKSDRLDVHGFERDELNIILTWICTS